MEKVQASSDISIIPASQTAQNGSSARLGKRIHTLFGCSHVALIDVSAGRSAAESDSEALGLSLRRQGAVVSSEISADCDLVLLFSSSAGAKLDTEVLASAAGSAKPVVLISMLGAGINPDSFLNFVRLVSKALLSAGYVRDYKFTYPGHSYLAASYCHDAGVYPDINDYEVRTARLEYELARRTQSTLENLLASNPDAVSEHQDGQAKKMAQLVKRAEAAEQQMLVAQDALRGAQAEKARAAGRTAEVEYHVGIREAEIEGLVEDIESLESTLNKLGVPQHDMRLYKNGGTTSWKQRLRRRRVGAMLAGATRSLRQRG